MNPALVSLAIQEAPEIIERLRQLFAKQNPGAPMPSSAEIIQAYQSAFVSSLAQDDAWLAAHPVL